MNAQLEKLLHRCNEMDITEQLNWLGDASMSYQAQLEYAEKDNALKQLKEYFEENHAERIKYPEYLEFHHYHMILLALGIVEKL